MRLIFTGSCPKDPNGSDINEDKWAFSESTSTLALCDGASESFDSSIWAQILADKFTSDVSIDSKWVSEALAEYVSRHDFGAMTWSRQASYERGSFSTLLGAQHIAKSKSIEIFAAGDSLAVLTDGDKFVASWPYTDPDSFKNRPTLFATLPEHNVFVSASDFWTTHGIHFDIDSLACPLLVCVTDALGEWLLRQIRTNSNGLSRLLNLKTEDELIHLVQEERSSGLMRVDDSTLIVAAFDNGATPDDVSVL